MKILANLGIVLMIISALLFMSNRIYQGLVLVSFATLGYAGNSQCSFTTILVYVASALFFLLGAVFVGIEIIKHIRAGTD